MKSDQELCAESGFDAYLSKPLNSRELLAVMARVAGGDASVSNHDSPVKVTPGYGVTPG